MVKYLEGSVIYYHFILEVHLHHTKYFLKTKSIFYKVESIELRLKSKKLKLEKNLRTNQSPS